MLEQQTLDQLWNFDDPALPEAGVPARQAVGIARVGTPEQPARQAIEAC